MVEIGKVLGEGFDIWKRNLNICLPFVFSTLLSFIFVIFTFGAALLVAPPSLFRLLEKLPQESQFPQAYTPTPPTPPIPPEVASQIISEFARNWVILLVAGIISAIILLFINAYFVAGAIGMAKEAHLKGKTSLSDMIHYGSKKFLSLLGADIIVGLIALLGLIFLIPSIVFILPYLPYITPSPGETFPPELMLTFLALLLIGIILFVIYALIISIVLALTRYAVVIEDLRAVEGVKTAFKRFLEHKLDVFLMWLIVTIIGVGISLAADLFGNLINLLSGVPVGSLIGIIVSLVVVQPLTVVWWSGFYLRLTPPKETQGAFGWEGA
ncbi:MAG: hypothetical protein N2V74_01715 [Candidatus Methanospirare jalkutatii]|nr:MAG: hypothetical protein N2V74_04145 [Candidatus Methanospirare jalkutatii]UYZ40439.1 MAG: hypothetical protein N2V74_01715 [Candidatus Methanospirare jalkutatii]